MKTRKTLKIATAIAVTTAIIAAPAAAFAANIDEYPASALTTVINIDQTAEITEADELTAIAADQAIDQKGGFGGGEQNSGFGGMGPGNGGPGGQMGGMGQSNASYASSPSEIVTSSLTENSAEGLSADSANAQTIVMSASNSEVKITEAGTYIITGTCSNGNITVKKGTTSVVLILKDLDLTSTTGATLSLNKGSEVKVVIEGSVKLTDAESLADEDTDDFDGAAIKAKAGSSVVITGDGTLTVNGSCKNGIKVSDLDDDDKADGYTEASLIIDGEDLNINITAANDGINSGTDLTIKSGNITVAAGDDGIKADYILTIGEDGTSGPTINVTKSYEGLEGATINIYSGNIDVVASDDGINAANGDLTGYTYSLNVMGGTINVSAGADGIDSNGNVNIIGGLTTIVKSASNGGEGGLDYDGTCYIADGTFVNPYGTTMDSGMGGMSGGRGHMNWGWQNNQSNGSEQNPSSDDNNNQIPFGDFKGEMPDDSNLGGWGRSRQNGSTDGDSTEGWQFPGMGGQRPEMNGERPDFGGKIPGMNSERPDLPDGEMPGLPDGEPREMDGIDGYEQAAPWDQDQTEQSPDKQKTESQVPNREAPENQTKQTQSSAQEEPPAQDTQNTYPAEQVPSTNWFLRLIETIKSWFTKSINN